jgi:hypothetical protein|tara:strand:- start:790 stop:927 length:138 start_codon:yes stop_codon:yes gene_type:complete
MAATVPAEKIFRKPRLSTYLKFHYSKAHDVNRKVTFIPEQGTLGF